jgi:hypothetical protein
MGNWAPWGDRHLAVNSLHSQVAAFIREKKGADVEVLDCRALGLDDDEMLDEVEPRSSTVSTVRCSGSKKFRRAS